MTVVSVARSQNRWALCAPHFSINHQALSTGMCSEVITDGEDKPFGKLQNSTALCAEVTDEDKNTHFPYFCFPLL